MFTHICFLLGLSLMFVHEMDAIQQHEWRIFPLIDRLSDKLGYVIFMALHVPLYLALLVWMHDGSGFNEPLIRGLDIFFIVHVGLHILFLKHPKNEFKSGFSWFIIFACGFAGCLDLLM